MIALYARVSTQEQAEHGYSIGEQTERLKKYAEALGWNSYALYVDAGFSGAKLDRPDLQRLIGDVKSGIINKVVVYKLDRLSRSQKDTLYLIEDVFLANNCDFVSMTENFDTTTPLGKAMIGIMSVFAQLEREQIKERMTMGRIGRAKQGNYHGGAIAPIGYKYEHGDLIIDDYEAMQVKEIYGMYLNGMSAGEIEKELLNRGWQTRNGQWRNATIRNVLKREIYIGKVRFRGVTYEGSHTPIINRKTFDAVQRVRESRKGHGHYTNRRSALLAGILWCNQCGAKYMKHNSNDPKYSYYTCLSKYHKHLNMIKNVNCKNQNWRTDRLDQIVINELLKLDAETILKKEDMPDTTKTIKKQIDALTAQRDRYIHLYGRGILSEDDLQRMIADTDAQITQLHASEKTKKKDLIPIVKSIKTVVESGNKEAIRAVIDHLIARINLDNDDVFIVWRF